MLQNKYQTYKQQSVLTMTQGEMLTAVFDGLLKALYTAEKEFEAKNYSEINRNLQKAQAILNYLKSTLNAKYEISQNLESLYDFFIEQIKTINIHKDPTGLADVISMIAELRESFIQADKNIRTGVKELPQE